jgi:hypothetical protein
MKVGQTVQCINDEGQQGTPPFVVKGQIYKIAGTITSEVHGEGIRLEDMDMGPFDYLRADRFCEIIDRSLEE